MYLCLIYEINLYFCKPNIANMNKELIDSIAEYVENNIGEFHKARIAKLIV